MQVRGARRMYTYVAYAMMLHGVTQMPVACRCDDGIVSCVGNVTPNCKRETRACRLFVQIHANCVILPLRPASAKFGTNKHLQHQLGTRVGEEEGWVLATPRHRGQSTPITPTFLTEHELVAINPPARSPARGVRMHVCVRVCVRASVWALSGTQTPCSSFVCHCARSLCTATCPTLRWAAFLVFDMIEQSALT